MPFGAPSHQGGCALRSIRLPQLFIAALNTALTQQLSPLLCRRYTEKTIGYAESHDQALVGDQTVGELDSWLQPQFSGRLLDMWLPRCRCEPPNVLARAKHEL